MVKTEITKSFSKGELEKVYNNNTENAIWTVIEENKFVDKQAIIANFEQVANYFKSVTSNFETLNIISEANKVVTKGTAEFLRDNERMSFVSVCDFYEFTIDNQIQKVTSYCIQVK